MAFEIADNYGGRWTKELRNIVRKTTLNGCRKEKLYAVIGYTAGLSHKKTVEILNDMAKFPMIEEREDGLIWWIADIGESQINFKRVKPIEEEQTEEEKTDLQKEDMDYYRYVKKEEKAGRTPKSKSKWQEEEKKRKESDPRK